MGRPLGNYACFIFILAVLAMQMDATDHTSSDGRVVVGGVNASIDNPLQSGAVDLKLLHSLLLKNIGGQISNDPSALIDSDNTSDLPTNLDLTESQNIWFPMLINAADTTTSLPLPWKNDKLYKFQIYDYSEAHKNIVLSDYRNQDIRLIAVISLVIVLLLVLAWICLARRIVKLVRRHIAVDPPDDSPVVTSPDGVVELPQVLRDIQRNARAAQSQTISDGGAAAAELGAGGDESTSCGGTGKRQWWPASRVPKGVGMGSPPLPKVPETSDEETPPFHSIPETPEEMQAGDSEVVKAVEILSVDNLQKSITSFPAITNQECLHESVNVNTVEVHLQVGDVSAANSESALKKEIIGLTKDALIPSQLPMSVFCAGELQDVACASEDISPDSSVSPTSSTRSSMNFSSPLGSTIYYSQGQFPPRLNTRSAVGGSSQNSRCGGGKSVRTCRSAALPGELRVSEGSVRDCKSVTSPQRGPKTTTLGCIRSALPLFNPTRWLQKMKTMSIFDLSSQENMDTSVNDSSILRDVTSDDLNSMTSLSDSCSPNSSFHACEGVVSPCSFFSAEESLRSLTPTSPHKVMSDDRSFPKCQSTSSPQNWSNSDTKCSTQNVGILRAPRNIIGPKNLLHRGNSNSDSSHSPSGSKNISSAEDFLSPDCLSLQQSPIGSTTSPRNMNSGELSFRECSSQVSSLNLNSVPRPTRDSEYLTSSQNDNDLKGLTSYDRSNLENISKEPRNISSPPIFVSPEILSSEESIRDFQSVASLQYVSSVEFSFHECTNRTSSHDLHFPENRMQNLQEISPGNTVGPTPREECENATTGSIFSGDVISITSPENQTS